MPGRRRRQSVSSLRSRMNERMREIEREKKGLTSKSEPRFNYSPVLNLFKQMHRFLLLKVVISLTLILAISLLYKSDTPAANKIIEGTRKMVYWHMDLSFFRDEALPAIKSVFTRANERFSFSWGYNGGALPLDGRVTSTYGMRINPVTGTEEMHYGIDISGKEGDRVYAVVPGKITVLEKVEGSYRMVIEHEKGWSSVYEGLGEVMVALGEEVKVNRVLGKLGPKRLWDGPHLHFELRREGRPQDPLPLLNYKTGI